MDSGKEAGRKSWLSHALKKWHGCSIRGQGHIEEDAKAIKQDKDDDDDGVGGEDF